VDLVLQITVDQLRGDQLTRFVDRFGPGGFRYLMEGGTHFTNAHYLHANTETAPGHASLVTGASPSRHGIIANDWIDQQTGAFVYNTEDDRHHVLGAEPRPHQGVSPRNLLASTVGDELVIHTGGRSRAFGVSIKDRGAILPAGHAGKAFWFDRRQGRFVTSTFYYDEVPDWVDRWNGRDLLAGYRGRSWELLHERGSYIAAHIDDRPYEGDFDTLGRTFPHFLGDGTSRFFSTVVSITPMGDEMSLDFAKALLSEEQVGQRHEVDYLQISFSSVDYAGHLFGPSSLEAEDALLRLDRLLAELFSTVDDLVGLDRTLIVLSADHGGPEAPDYMADHGFQTARFPLDWFRAGNPLADAFEARYGRSDFIQGHSHPWLYLDTEAILDAGEDVSEVETFVAREIVKVDGIAYALTRSDLLAGRVADAPIQNQIRRSFHPTRSGNVYMVQEQYSMLHSTLEAEQMGVESMAAIHGSPWVYDTHVPILFAGPGIPNQRVARRVSPYDVAPTISVYLGIKQPSGSVGDPLGEILPRL
jgi:hypothetical protein